MPEHLGLLEVVSVPQESQSIPSQDIQEQQPINTKGNTEEHNYVQSSENNTPILPKIPASEMPEHPQEQTIPDSPTTEHAEEEKEIQDICSSTHEKSTVEEVTVEKSKIAEPEEEIQHDTLQPNDEHSSEKEQPSMEEKTILETQPALSLAERLEAEAIKNAQALPTKEGIGLFSKGASATIIKTIDRKAKEIMTGEVIEQEKEQEEENDVKEQTEVKKEE